MRPRQGTDWINVLTYYILRRCHDGKFLLQRGHTICVKGRAWPMTSPRGKMRWVVVARSIRKNVREPAVVPATSPYKRSHIEENANDAYPFRHRPDGKNKQGGLPPRPPNDGLRGPPRR